MCDRYFFADVNIYATQRANRRGKRGTMTIRYSVERLTAGVSRCVAEAWLKLNR
jgi:hypothetical protein